MKIFAISDLHISRTSDKPMEVFGGNWVGYLDKIKADWTKKAAEGDVVLIPGDISWAMDLKEALFDMEEFSALPGEKILVRGNHDYWWKSISRIRESLPPHVYALQNDAVRLGNVVFCGSRGWSVPGTPGFSETDEKLYSREAERFRLSLLAAERMRREGDRLVVLIHYPPFNVKRENSLFTDLFERAGADAVIYGHLHGRDVRADRLVIKNGVAYYLTSCDLTDNQLTEVKL